MTSTTIVKAPIIPQGGNINLTSGSLTGSVPLGYYDGTETITASDTDLLATNIKSGVNIFGVSGSFSGMTNPLFSNIEMNVSGIVVMADAGSNNYAPGFTSGAVVVGGNLYQVFDIMHRDDNNNSSYLGHYTIVVKRTPAGVVTRYTHLWAAGTFNTPFANNTTININGTVIQIHSALGVGFFATFDTTTDTFSSLVPGPGGASIEFWSDYSNFGTNNLIFGFGAALSVTALTGGVSGSAISSTASFGGSTYGGTHLCVHRNLAGGNGQSFQIAFSTKS